MRFAVLGSGSRGNATVVESASTCVMIDCGFSMKETERRLGQLDYDAKDVSAILLTHEHSDHIKGVGALSRKYGIPVWATRGTAQSHQLGHVPELNHLDTEHGFTIDGLEISSFPVPHDAKEPCQFVFSDGDVRFAILTDTGSTTAHIEQMLSSCDAMMLECNHDRDMLQAGYYPQSLKDRVAGPFGHLSNDQAAAFLTRVDTSKLKHIVAAHLSEKNNAPHLASDALSGALNCEEEWISLATQDECLPWRTV